MVKLFLSILTLAAVSACSSPPAEEEKKPEEDKKPATPSVVGSIRTVSERGKFVLIQKLGPGKLPENGSYQTLANDGTSAALNPSGERVRNLFAADILLGNPNPGDAVLFRPDDTPPPPKPAAEEPEPSEPKAAPEEKETPPESAA